MLRKTEACIIPREISMKDAIRCDMCAGRIYLHRRRSRYSATLNECGTSGPEKRSYLSEEPLIRTVLTLQAFLRWASDELEMLRQPFPDLKLEA